MEVKDKEAFDALKAAHKALEGENKKMKTSLEKSQVAFDALQKKHNSLHEDLKTTGSQVIALQNEKSACMQDLNKVTMERDNALQLITELSTQVADQSKVQTEKDILVKVDGKKYLLERRSVHTLHGEVKAEDAAKNEEFLRTLISSGGGNIRPVEN